MFMYDTDDKVTREPLTHKQTQYHHSGCVAITGSWLFDIH